MRLNKRPLIEMIAGWTGKATRQKVEVKCCGFKSKKINLIVSFQSGLLHKSGIFLTSEKHRAVLANFMKHTYKQISFRFY